MAARDWTAFRRSGLSVLHCHRQTEAANGPPELRRPHVKPQIDQYRSRSAFVPDTHPSITFYSDSGSGEWLSGSSHPSYTSAPVSTLYHF